MVADKLPPRTEFDDLDDLPPEVFKPGELGKVMVPGLVDLINHYMKDNPKRELVVGFVKWCPSSNMEEFLVKALEYATDKTKPGSELRKKTTRHPKPAAPSKPEPQP